MANDNAESRYPRRTLLKGTAHTAGLVGAGAMAGVGTVAALSGNLAGRSAAAAEANNYTVG